MKKTVLFLFLSLVMIGCKSDENHSFTAGYNDCDRTIVIDKSKISADWENWETRNREYYSSSQPTTANECTHGKIYISAEELQKRGTKTFADWLKENGSYICYKETSSYIECEHLITNPDDIKAINAINTHSTLTIGKIKEKIAALGGDYESYERYMKITLGFFGRTKITLESPFDPDSNYYSLPLIKSIINNNGLGENAKFIFKKVKIYGENKIIFGVEISPENYNYYNFSHIPPFIGTPVTSPI